MFDQQIIDLYHGLVDSSLRQLPFDASSQKAFLDSGRQDKLFPTKDARALVRQLRPVYDLFEQPRSHLGLEVHDGAHEIAGKRSIPWMLKRLRED
jgi:hypothetical protein